jgi:undecaprenyl diphosphate synthase
MEPLRKSEQPAPPRHVAIIMDGNGRWATARGLPRTAGHHRGADAARRTVVGAAEMGIGYLTLFSFSSENWRRPPAEIDDLMGLLRFYLRKEISTLQESGVRLRVIGERDRLDPEIVTLIERAENETAANTRLTLVIALSYGARAEIAGAARRIAEAIRNGTLDPSQVDEKLLAHHLLTDGIPDPDLIIRTSGEKRLSNFLLWQAAYAELMFIDRYWPDFTKEDLEDAVRAYHGRERRYGATA